MAKIVAVLNMTLDGFCDHTYGIPDAELHQHYADLFKTAGTALYGRITYRLMEYWRTVLANPTGDKAMDNFAVAIGNIPKTLNHLVEACRKITFKKSNNGKKQINGNAQCRYRGGISR